MAQCLCVLHSADFLANRIEASKKTGGLTNLQLCTLNLVYTKINYSSREYRRLISRIRECIGTIEMDKLTLTAWFFNGLQIVPEKIAMENVSNDFATEIVKKLFELSYANSMVAFEIKNGKKLWLFIVE